MIRNINQTVWELIIGIVSLNIILEVAGVLFVADKADYTIGLLIGMVTAIFMVFHMSASIETAIDIGGEHIKGHIIKSYAIRTFVVLIIIIAVGVLKIGNLISLLVGIMTLKVAAYLQPITHKFIEGRKSSNKEKAEQEQPSENKR